MSLYQDALEATEEHLRALQVGGVRFLNVHAETLKVLQQPVPVSAAAPPVNNVENNRTKAPEKALRRGVEPQAPDPIKSTPEQTVSASSPSPTANRETAALPTATALPTKLGEGEKAVAMAKLRERALACVKCPNLVASRHSVVFGVGDINARLMFVGEAPGADEDLQGEPFVGAAGQLLTRIIKAMGYSRETVYIANILKCRPDTPGQTSGNRKPTPAEMQTCIPWLHEQIDLMQPEVIVALGGVAVEGLLGKGDGISRLRGRFQTYRGIPIMPTFHPSYLLRNQAITEKRKVWEDMLQVLEKLGAPITEKQRGFFLKA
jgi:DNA polymerase